MQEIINGAFGSVLVVLWGMVIGSFLTVVIHRLPRGGSIVRPGSHCPHCHTPLRWRDNIPLVGFLLLRGRCRACHERISPLYPLIELTTAALFLLAFHQTGLSALFLLNCGFIAALIALAAIDAQHRILPDAITYPGFVLAMGLRALIPQASLKTDLLSVIVLPWDVEGGEAVIGAFAIGATGLFLLLVEWLDYLLLGKKIEAVEAANASEGNRDPSGAVGESAIPEGFVAQEDSESETRRGLLEWSTLGMGVGLGGLFYLLAQREEALAQAGVESLLCSWLGAAVGGGFLWFSRLAYFAVRRLEGVGFGDVKMMFLVGAYLGWQGAFTTILLGSLLGSVYGISLMLIRRERNPKMPFGLFLGAAALVALLVTPGV
jgi:leader peptidase (prepilin peptidase)/N-methyltransferase